VRPWLGGERPMRAVRYHEYGPPEVLRIEDLSDPEPGPGEVLIRVAAAGVNYAEVQLRGRAIDLDWFPVPSLPVLPGGEVAGTVLVQLAKRAGAWVVGVARGERKLAVAKRLGADAVVDYTEPGWDQRVREAAGGDVHVVFETVGGDLARTAFELLEAGVGR